MTECQKIKNNLLLLVHDVLAPNERKALERHLMDCPECRETYEKITSLFKEEEEEPPDLFDSIIKKARTRKKNIYFNVLMNIFLIQKKFLIKQKKLIIFVICLLGISTFLILYLLPHDHLYITYTLGDVILNETRINYESPFQYPLNKAMNIYTVKGECRLQINQNILLVLKNNTSILVNPSSLLEIELKKGVFIAEMVKNRKKEKLLVRADKYVFEIKGTIFAVEKQEGKLEFLVKEGLVQCVSGEVVTSISENQKLRIIDEKMDKINFTHESIFNNIENYYLIRDFSKVEKIRLIEGIEKGPEQFMEEDLKELSGFVLIHEKGNNMISHDQNETNIKQIKYILPQELYLLEDFSKWKWQVDKSSKINVLKFNVLREKQILIADYNFGQRKNWFQFTRDLDLKIKDYSTLSFEFQDSNPMENALSIRISDLSDSYFGYTIKIRYQPNQWHKVSIPLSALKYLWGRNKTLNLSRATRIFFALEIIEGGQGTLQIRNIILQ